jgi:hypothetical protein
MSWLSPAAIKTKNVNGPPAPQSVPSAAEQAALQDDSPVLSWAGFSDSPISSEVKGDPIVEMRYDARKKGMGRYDWEGPGGKLREGREVGYWDLYWCMT